jgi:hypothetical protein
LQSFDGPVHRVNARARGMEANSVWQSRILTGRFLSWCYRWQARNASINGEALGIPRSLVLARNGHAGLVAICPFVGMKRTFGLFDFGGGLVWIKLAG